MEHGVQLSMRRRAVIGTSAASALLLVCALLVFRHFRGAVLRPSALALKPIAPPTAWGDLCGPLLHAVRDFNTHAVENGAGLSADEVAIYKAVLQSWQSNSTALLSLSNRTIPLDTRFPDISDCACLTGIGVQNLMSASRSFHRLTRDVLSASNIRLVDANSQIRTVQKNDPRNWIGTGKSVKNAVNDAFATGLFSVSEVAFDKQHRRAQVMYTFVCGSLCGSGRTWQFEKVNGVWKKTDHVCGGWIS